MRSPAKTLHPLSRSAKATTPARSAMMMRCKDADAPQRPFDASAENRDQYVTTIEARDELYTVERRSVNMITKALITPCPDFSWLTRRHSGPYPGSPHMWPARIDSSYRAHASHANPYASASTSTVCTTSKPVLAAMFQRHVSLSQTATAAPEATIFSNSGLPTACAMAYFSCL